jgi:DNA-binding SARP family transcriptional activator
MNSRARTVCPDLSPPARDGGADPTAPHSVSIAVLGGFSVTVNGVATPAGGWARRSSSSLVKILALAPGHRLHREHVIDVLWPDEDPASAANRLHKAAHFARRAARHADAVVLRNDLVWLFPDSEITVDALRFEHLARLAVSADDAVLARKALAWYGGELLPADRYEDWAGERREVLALRRLDVLRVAGEWRDLSEFDPTDAQAAVRLIRRHVDAGDRDAAVREYERLERVLDRELGITPPESARRARAEADLLAAPLERDRARGAEDLLAELTLLQERQRVLLAELAAVGVVAAGPEVAETLS